MKQAPTGLVSCCNPLLGMLHVYLPNSVFLFNRIYMVGGWYYWWIAKTIKKAKSTLQVHPSVSFSFSLSVLKYSCLCLRASLFGLCVYFPWLFLLSHFVHGSVCLFLLSIHMSLHPSFCKYFGLSLSSKFHSVSVCQCDAIFSSKLDVPYLC